MNTGQMMITMAAMMLLSTVILNVNRNSLNNSETMAESKYQILAISLGTALIEEAFSKAFDEETANNKIAEKLNDLSISTGPNNSEKSKSQFNDFDDFNGFIDSTSNDPTLLSANFTINSKVYYVDPEKHVDLKPVTYKTWHKKIDVYVSSPFMNEGLDTVKLSKVYSYFYFR